MENLKCFEQIFEISAENKIDINDEDFNKLYDEHKEKSKAEKSLGNENMDIEVELNEFVGYENTESTSKIYQVETYDDKFIIFTEEKFITCFKYSKLFMSKRTILLREEDIIQIFIKTF